MEGRARERLVSLAVLMGVTALVVFGWRNRSLLRPAAAGDRLPAFAAPTLGGDTLALGDLRGRVVIVNLWATWCGPCRAEMPSLERLERRLGGRGLSVVGVNVDEGQDTAAVREKVRKFAADLGLTFPILLDPRGRLEERLSVEALPTTLVVDRGGRIVERVVGGTRWDGPPHLDRVRKLLGR